MNDILQYILGALAIIGTIAGFIYWHFKTINNFKDEIHDIKLKQKDLEHRDEMQQQTINQLENLYPLLKETIKKISEEKK